MRLRSKYFTLSLLSLSFILPLFTLLALSLSKDWAFPHILPQQFDGENWQELTYPGSSIAESFFTSLSIALAVALTSTFLGFITSKFIAYHPYRNRLLKLTYFPFALSPVIFALCLKIYFIKAGLAGNLPGIIIAQLIIAYPYSIIYFMGFWNQQILNYQQVVYTLGGSSSDALRKVIIPIAKSLVLVCFFQCFLISWFEYGLTSIIGYGKVKTLTVLVFQFISEANIFYAALSCCLLIIPPVTLLWFNKKFILQPAK